MRKAPARVPPAILALVVAAVVLGDGCAGAGRRAEPDEPRGPLVQRYPVSVLPGDLFRQLARCLEEAQGYYAGQGGTNGERESMRRSVEMMVGKTLELARTFKIPKHLPAESLLAEAADALREADVAFNDPNASYVERDIAFSRVYRSMLVLRGLMAWNDGSFPPVTTPRQ